MTVVVVGAGPVGLMLACELSLAGLRPVVLEKRPEPSQLPRANGLVGQIVDLLEQRGLAERFRAESSYAGPMPGFPFGSVPLPFATLKTNPVRGILVQQPRIEHLLTERARELDVQIRAGHQVLDLSQDDESVTVDVRGPDGEYRLPADYLVGCDGGGSRVRELAGIAFPGTTDDEVLRLGHFRASDSASVFDSPGYEIPGSGRLRPGWNRTAHGRLLVSSLQSGVLIVGVRERDSSAIDRDRPPSLAEFRASVHRVIGGDLPLGEPIWLSQTVSQGRLAETYRSGRVLLAGDAAHLFPAGGSALNVGMLDAVNLGWKLAAEAQGRAPAGLLDSYHRERQPVGARALRQTRAQAALDRLHDEDGIALRALLTELFALEQPLEHLAATLQGSDTRYPMPGAGSPPHPLLGGFVPDLLLRTVDGPARVSDLMHAARPVLLDLGDRSDVREAAEPWRDRIRIVTAQHDDPPAAALLIRPDGHVAWAAGPADADAPGTLRTALSAWFRGAEVAIEG
jgi:2-polyprenyl-6-methoxyphenol hydroxylase-like FAD-dependent oxidoreductase